MAEPIISPWLIYFAEIADSIECVFVLGLILTFARAMVRCIYEEKFPSFSMWFIITLCALIVALVPPKDAIYKIIIASNVTPELLLKTGETAEAVATRALDLIADSVIKIIREVK